MVYNSKEAQLPNNESISNQRMLTPSEHCKPFNVSNFNFTNSVVRHQFSHNQHSDSLFMTCTILRLDQFCPRKLQSGSLCKDGVLFNQEHFNFLCG